MRPAPAPPAAPPLTRVFPRLFSAVGGFGCGATQAPEFRSPEALLAHLDRVGVTHSLVHHAAARDQDPTRGNQRLLRDLAGCPAAQGRLVPALAATPAQRWERGGVEALRAAMHGSGTRALRAFPATLRYRLYQLEPVLEAVMDRQPFLIVDVRDVGDARDILTLAETFPSLPIVCAQGMWPSLITLFDLMHRRPNILLETSWLHVGGIIADAVRHFGAGRVIFGLGPTAHEAAAIAGLAHAELSDEDRQRIAYGNLAGLMGPAARPGPADAEPTSKAPTLGTAQTRGALWSRFIRGEPQPVELIDAHGHLGAIALWGVHELDADEQIRTALPRMDRLGIRTMIVSGADALFSDPAEHNFALAERLRPHGERFRVYFVFNPYYARQLTPLLDRAFADPLFVGFKLLNDYWAVPVTDERFNPVWSYANAHRLPILLHTWDTAYNSPRMLTDIVARHPEAIFLLGHSGGGATGRREAEELANANPNVYLEWCGSFCCATPWEETLARVNPRQVVFGTDGVYHDLSWELGRLLSLEVDDAVLGPILGENMRRVLAMRRYAGKGDGPQPARQIGSPATASPALQRSESGA